MKRIFRAAAVVVTIAAALRLEAAPRCVAQKLAGLEGPGFVVCTVDARVDKVRLFDIDDSGAPLGSFARLVEDRGQHGETLAWAMNAGMYDATSRPVGLYVERGKTVQPLSLRDGPGNFHMKPNGVFYIAGDRVGVQESAAFGVRKVDWATQSGPMLVIDGAIHPRIMPTGTSRKLRNGVGMLDEHRALFVISDAPVTFYELASLFRDVLGCKNALFLDGTVSSLFSPELGRHDDVFPLGPIVGVVTSTH